MGLGWHALGGLLSFFSFLLSPIVAGVRVNEYSYACIWLLFPPLLLKVIVKIFGVWDE